MADEYNFQIPKEGFDSYLYTIIPEDQAVLAGAFGVSMQQIKSISEVDFKNFAKVVYSLETNNGLNLTNGTNVPTETFTVDSALTKVALGSGLYGTYTFSDFMGSMTGLPYPLQNIYEGILQLQTQNLTDLYKEIWQISIYGTATAEVEYEVNNLNQYVITGIKITNSGGGYTASPVISLSNGGTASLTIGSDPEDPATYTRVSTITLTNSGPAWPTIPTISISAPPVYPVYNTWQLRNNRLSILITAVNNEIQNIATATDESFKRAKLLNANWNALGTALKIEHRARYTAIPPVPIPRDPFVALYPTALYNFVNSIPEYAANTLPHGPAQSLEMTSDMCSPGGQSIIGLMRESRNQDRLSEVGITLDNTIPDTLSDEDIKELLGNGTKCGATKNTIDDQGNIIPGAGIQSENGLSFAMPAFPSTEDCDGTVMKPIKDTYYDSENDALRKTDDSIPGSIEPLLENPNCSGGGVGPEGSAWIAAGPEIPAGPSELLSTGIPNFVIGIEGNVLPTTLNVDFTNGTLLPAQYSVPDAIDNVIACNCDCWV